MKEPSDSAIIIRVISVLVKACLVMTLLLVSVSAY